MDVELESGELQPSSWAVLDAIRNLTKDERAAASTLGRDEARFLVDAYYTMQENRIRATAQVRALSQSGEPNAVLQWLARMNLTLEQAIKVALDCYSASQPIGQWMRRQKGVGPVISAGLIAHLDIHKAKTAGAFWSFAGLDPSVRWEKGQKRPWNADLKVLCWKLGESFVKVSNLEDAFYGRFYRRTKDELIARNERGEFAEAARMKLEQFKIGKDTEAYKHYSQGRLPPAHIHARARRVTVKLFLSHLHEVWWKLEFGTEPPKPFSIAILNHTHYIPPPE